MACYSPIKAYYSYEKRGVAGKGSIKFSRLSAGFSSTILLPCGQCIGCRINKAREWALRCVNEASLYENNCFITLTYRDEELKKNKGGSLVKEDFQKFMKRLRKRFKGIEEVKGKYPIRYFQCGEYGEKFERPHYHACLFNFDFGDKVLWQIRNGNRLYRSKDLESLWKYGYSLIGNVTYESAAYVARYCVKKVNGERAKEHYRKVDLLTGELLDVVPEYITMSRRPGIGREWFERFKSDCFPKDFVTCNGKICKVPKYYWKMYGDSDSKGFSEVRKKRLIRAKEMVDDNDMWRLDAKRKVKQAMTKVLKRGYEDDTFHLQHV